MMLQNQIVNLKNLQIDKKQPLELLKIKNVMTRMLMLQLKIKNKMLKLLWSMDIRLKAVYIAEYK